MYPTLRIINIYGLLKDVVRDIGSIYALMKAKKRHDMFVVNAYSMSVVPILSTSMSFYVKFEVYF